MRTDRDYADSMELVEAVMEWLGMRWTESMIKRQLRDYFGEHLSFQTCKYLIKAAKAEIRKRFNIDPQEYKGLQITFYESVIRRKEEKTKNQLTAAERLDKLFGLEQITFDDPEIMARKIREGIASMKESVSGENDGGNEEVIKENGGEGKNDAENKQEVIQSAGDGSSGNERNETNKEEPIIEDSSISSKIPEELKNIKPENMDRFRKDRDK